LFYGDIMSHAIKSLLVSAILLTCASASMGAQMDQQVAMPTSAAVSLDGSMLSSVSPFYRARHDGVQGSPSNDRLLSVMLAASLIALKLRRRQKSMRNPRLLTR
jgi:hypothetical protein